MSSLMTRRLRLSECSYLHSCMISSFVSHICISCHSLDHDFASYLVLNALVPGFKKTINEMPSEELSNYYARVSVA